MRSTGLRRAGTLPAFLFVTILAALTGLRAFDLLPSTPVQSALVHVCTAAVVGFAAYVYRGGVVATGWLLAFGPATAFPANLFVPAWQGGPLVLVASVVATGTVASGAFTLVGYGGGRLARIAWVNGPPRAS